MLSEGGGTVPVATRSCHGKRECRAERGSGTCTDNVVIS